MAAEPVVLDGFREDLQSAMLRNVKGTAAPREEVEGVKLRRVLQASQLHKLGLERTGGSFRSKDDTDALLALWTEERRLTRITSTPIPGRPRSEEYEAGEELVKEVVAMAREQEAAEAREFEAFVSRSRGAIIEASLLGPRTANGLRYLPKARTKRSGLCGLAGFACGKPGHLCGIFENDEQAGGIQRKGFLSSLLTQTACSPNFSRLLLSHTAHLTPHVVAHFRWTWPKMSSRPCSPKAACSY